MDYPIPDPGAIRERSCDILHSALHLTEEHAEVREFFNHLCRVKLDVEPLSFCAAWMRNLYCLASHHGITSVQLVYEMADALEHRVRPESNGDRRPGIARLRSLLTKAEARAREQGWIVLSTAQDGYVVLSGLGRQAAKDYRLTVTRRGNDRPGQGTCTMQEFVLSQGFRLGREAKRARWRFVRYLRRNLIMPAPMEPGQITRLGRPAKAARYDTLQLSNLWQQYRESGHMTTIPKPKEHRSRE